VIDVHAPRAVMAGALLHGFHAIGDQAQQIAAANADVLNANVAGHVVLDRFEATLEVALQSSFAGKAIEKLIQIMRALGEDTLDLTQFEEEMEDSDRTMGLYSPKTPEHAAFTLEIAA